MPLKTPFISFQNHKINEVDSTNLEISRRLQNIHLEEGYLLRADFQDDGKGQGNALWESEKGQNLLFSFVLRPQELALEDQFYISMTVSLALHSLVELYLPNKKIKIKWPNDIYVDNQKIAGILIENAIQGNKFEWLIVGIGLNVNQEIFHADASTAISFKMLQSKSLSVDKLLIEFEEIFAQIYAQLNRGNYEGIKSDYLKLMYQRNEWKSYRNNGIEFTGKILGIDNFGFLRMETPSGERSFDIKEVEYFDF